MGIAASSQATDISRDGSVVVGYSPDSVGAGSAFVVTGSTPAGTQIGAYRWTEAAGFNRVQSEALRIEASALPLV